MHIRTPHLLLTLALTLSLGCQATAPVPYESVSAISAHAPPAERGSDSGSPESLPRSGSLEDYIAYGLRNHPALEAQRARWEAQSHRVESLDRIDRPWVRYGFAPLPIYTANGPRRHSISVLQTFPWPGSRRVASDVAIGQARVMERAFDAETWKIRRDITTHYWILWELERRREVLSEQLVLLQTLAESARAQVEIGNQPASILGQIAIDQVEIQDRLHGIEDHSEAHVAQFLNAMGIEAHAADVSITSSYPSELRMPGASLDELLDTRAAHPTILTAREEIALAEQRVSFEESESHPSLQLGAEYSLIGRQGAGSHAVNPGRDAVMVSVGAQAPLFGGADDAREDAARAEVIAAHSSLTLTYRDLGAAIQAAHARLRHQVYRAHLIEDVLLPQVETTYALMLADYEVGRVPFSSVLEISRKMLALRFELVSVRAEHANIWAELEYLTARTLTPSTTRAPMRHHTGGTHE